MSMRKVGVVLQLLALLSSGPWTSVVMAQVTVTSNSTSSSSSNGTSTDTSTTNTTRPACYTSFRDIMVDMAKKDPFSFEKYIVCPNTLIEIGTPVSLGSTEFVNGDTELTMRQFSRVYCGEDGASSNNCIVRGGKTQVSVTHFSYDFEAKKRMEVKGFTFEAAENLAVFAIFPEGDLLLEDCIFRDITQGGVLTASVAAQLSPDITFRNCQFDNNMVGNIGHMFDTNSGARLTITDSVFSNNMYKSDRLVRFCHVSSLRIVLSLPIISHDFLLHDKLTSTHIITTHPTTTTQMTKQQHQPSNDETKTTTAHHVRHSGPGQEHSTHVAKQLLL
jgi:hypothetical protein